MLVTESQTVVTRQLYLGVIAVFAYSNPDAYPVSELVSGRFNMHA